MQFPSANRPPPPLASSHLQVHRAVRSLQAAYDRDGPHSFINQADLQVLWRYRFKGCGLKVEWSAFWAAFPEDLAKPEVSMDPKSVERLKEIFKDSESRLRFQQLLEIEDPSTVSVLELKLFTAEEDLVQAVEELMGVTGTIIQGEGSSFAVNAPAALSGGLPPLVLRTPGSSRLPPLAPPTPGPSRFRLPPVDAHYCGREEIARRVIGLLTRRLQQQALAPSANPEAPGMVVIMAQGGMGKSCLALDVGWQLQREGMLGCGALLVDLREARSAGEVEARFCSTLNLSQVGGC